MHSPKISNRFVLTRPKKLKWFKTACSFVYCYTHTLEGWLHVQTIFPSYLLVFSLITIVSQKHCLFQGSARGNRIAHVCGTENQTNRGTLLRDRERKFTLHIKMPKYITQYLLAVRHAPQNLE